MTQKKLNVVVVICHDLGQHLGCYGASEVRSRHLDRFADSAIRFENAFCTAPQCSPSRAALWTGRYPHSNGVVGLTHGGFGNELNAGERHLAQILREAGYETHAFGHLHEVREAERSGHEHLHGAGNCGTIAGDFAGVLKRRTDRARPFFAEICFFEPHRPFPHDGVERLNPAGLTVPRDAVFAEKTYHTYYDPMRAIRTKRWKLIANFEFAPWQETSPDYNNNAKGYVETSKALSVPYAIQYHPPFELFDLVADPCEQTNLAEDPALADVRDELVRRLRGWMVETGDPLLEGPMAQGAYRERMNAFKSL
jgi:arylsulfatase A-like enzyme